MHDTIAVFRPSKKVDQQGETWAIECGARKAARRPCPGPDSDLAPADCHFKMLAGPGFAVRDCFEPESGVDGRILTPFFDVRSIANELLVLFAVVSCEASSHNLSVTISAQPIRL